MADAAINMDPAGMDTDYAFSFTPGERRIFKAREDVTVSAHADKHRQVTRGPWKGQWDTVNTEYTRFPMDLWNQPWVRKIFLCWGPQTGKTQVAINCLHYTIDQDPDAAFYVMSTEYTGKRIKHRQIDPMIESSPRVSGLVVDNTNTAISFKNGMDLMLAWATSVASLASESARYMFFDEVDKYEPPINLDFGDIRTNAYPHTKKILYFTTPEDEDRPITQLIRSEADVLYRRAARCPKCNTLQVMTFDRIRWPKEIRDHRKIIRGRLARYVCIHCENGWTDDHRNMAVRAGEWVPFVGEDVFGTFSEPPQKPSAVALHLPSWYSPVISLSEVSAAFLKGLRDPGKLRIFTTQHEAKPWVNKVKTTTTDKILSARVPGVKPQVIPAPSVALTCGIDVQKYGFWFLVRAWARDYTSWMIHYGWVTYWSEIEDLLFFREYPRAGGGPGQRIWRAGIDTGGGKYAEEQSSAEAVYMWLLENRVGRGCQVWGTKGSSKPLAGKVSVGKSLQHAPSGRALPGGIQVISLDTDKLKDLVHWRLDKAIAGTVETQQMAAYLHAETRDDYARQVMAESKRQDKRGRESWVQEYRENHLLDCEVIAHALADPEWPGGGVHLLSDPAEEPPSRKRHTPPDPRDRAAAIRERMRKQR